MTAVIGLLLMLFSVTDGVVTHCDGRQNGAQCYGALGGSVSIQLMDDFSEIYGYIFLKSNDVVMSGGRYKELYAPMTNRYSFIPSNGTFWINNLTKNDSDEYSLRTYHVNGRLTSIHFLQLSVQAPVSSVSLVSECLSQGEMKVSCSSEGGDSPQYRWTLNGKSLTEAELLSGNKQTNIITLKQHVSGLLVCSVSNDVSSAAKETNIRTCDRSTRRCSLMFLFSVVSIVGICIYFKWKKIKTEKDEQSAERHRTQVLEDSSENEQALYINL